MTPLPQTCNNTRKYPINSVFLFFPQWNVQFRMYNTCQFYLTFFLPFKFSFCETIYPKKKAISGTATVNFPRSLDYINNRPLILQSSLSHSVSDGWSAPPPPPPQKSRIGNHMIPQILPQILLYFPSSKNKFASLKLSPQTLHITRTYLWDKSQTRTQNYSKLSGSVDLDSK